MALGMTSIACRLVQCSSARRPSTLPLPLVPVLLRLLLRQVVLLVLQLLPVQLLPLVRRLLNVLPALFLQRKSVLL